MASAMDGSRMTLGFVGGTGPQGRGLGLRLGRAGHRVLLGSRSQERAAEAAAKVRGKDAAVDVAGVENAEACRSADVVFVTVPYEGQRRALESLRTAIADKVVVSCVNALTFDEDGPHPVLVAEGSAAEEAQALLPAATVVGAFQNVSATKLLRIPEPVDSDVVVVGDDPAAKEVVAALAEQIPDLRSVDAGPLRLARPVEEITAVLLAVNRRYGCRAGLRITDLPDDLSAPPSPR